LPITTVTLVGGLLWGVGWGLRAEHGHDAEQGGPAEAGREDLLAWAGCRRLLVIVLAALVVLVLALVVI
jgi:hypothetical protein